MDSTLKNGRNPNWAFAMALKTKTPKSNNFILKSLVNYWILVIGNKQNVASKNLDEGVTLRNTMAAFENYCPKIT